MFGKLAVVVGAVILFGAGLLMGRLWPNGGAATPTSSPALADETDWPGWLGKAARAGSRRPGGAAAAKANAPESAAISDSALLATAPRADAAVASPTVSSVVVGSAGRGTRASAGVNESASSSGVASSVIATVVPELTLSGTLEAADRPSIEVEFALRRRNESVTGVVRYLSAGERVAANAVSGRIRGGIVELHETSFIWRLYSNRPTPLSVDVGPDAAPATFVFELPAESKTGSILGDWSRGRSTGTLRVVPSSPW